MPVTGGVFAVAHVFAAGPEDDVFGDVGGVVGDALEVARNDDRVDAHARRLWVGLDQASQHELRFAVHAVDVVIHDAYLFGELRIGANERVQRAANHPGRQFGHLRQIDRQVDGRPVDQL